MQLQSGSVVKSVLRLVVLVTARSRYVHGMGDLGQVEIPGVGEAKEKLSLTL